MFSYKYNVAAGIDTNNDKDWEEKVKAIEKRNRNANKQFIHDVGHLSPNLFQEFKNYQKLEAEKEREKLYTPIFKSEAINKQWKLKKEMHKSLKLHTSIWGSNNPSWNAGINKWWKEQQNSLTTTATNGQNTSLDSPWSNKKQQRGWNEKMKNQSNQDTNWSHCNRKHDNNPFHSPFK